MSGERVGITRVHRARDEPLDADAPPPAPFQIYVNMDKGGWLYEAREQAYEDIRNSRRADVKDRNKAAVASEQTPTATLNTTPTTVTNVTGDPVDFNTLNSGADNTPFDLLIVDGRLALVYLDSSEGLIVGTKGAKGVKQTYTDGLNRQNTQTSTSASLRDDEAVTGGGAYRGGYPFGGYTQAHNSNPIPPALSGWYMSAFDNGAQCLSTVLDFSSAATSTITANFDSNDRYDELVVYNPVSGVGRECFGAIYYNGTKKDADEPKGGFSTTTIEDVNLDGTPDRTVTFYKIKNKGTDKEENIETGRITYFMRPDVSDE